MADRVEHGVRRHVDMALVQGDQDIVRDGGRPGNVVHRLAADAVQVGTLQRAGVTADRLKNVGPEDADRSDDQPAHTRPKGMRALPNRFVFSGCTTESRSGVQMTMEFWSKMPSMTPGIGGLPGSLVSRRRSHWCVMDWKLASV